MHLKEFKRTYSNLTYIISFKENTASVNIINDMCDLNQIIDYLKTQNEIIFDVDVVSDSFKKPNLICIEKSPTPYIKDAVGMTVYTLYVKADSSISKYYRGVLWFEMEY